MTDDSRDFIDPDEGRDFPSPFYTEAEPCESCGEPTYKGRVWYPEFQLWIATDCSCNAPMAPTCSILVPLLSEAVSVRQVCQVIRAHRASCPLCGPVEIRKRQNQEPAQIKREAA